MEASVTQNVVNTPPKALQVTEESGRENAIICLEPMRFWPVGHTADLFKRQDPRLFLHSQIRDGSRTSGPGADPSEGPPTSQPRWARHGYLWARLSMRFRPTCH